MDIPWNQFRSSYVDKGTGVSCKMLMPEHDFPLPVPSTGTRSALLELGSQKQNKRQRRIWEIVDIFQ